MQAGGQLNLNNPAQANPNLLVALANLQQTEQARQQQQALLQQQQGLYQNSLYQLSSSYQTTSLDWQEAYSHARPGLDELLPRPVRRRQRRHRQPLAVPCEVPRWPDADGADGPTGCSSWCCL